MARHVADLERDLAAKTADIRAKLTACEKAEEEGRAITAEEKKAIDDAMTEARTLKAQIERKKTDADLMAELERMTAGAAQRTNPSAGLLPAGNGNTGGGRVLTVGQQFIASDVYTEFIRNRRTLAGQRWQSPTLEAVYNPQSGLWAATLTEASGAAALVPVDNRPGVQELATRRLTVADLIASGTTDSNVISYVQESAFTNAADTVAEGGTKPESTLTFAPVTDTVRKIAHWIPVTEETLEDANQIRSIIDARMRLGVLLVEEDQLLQGSGVAPDILGIRNRTGIATAVVRDDAGGETNADAIFRQMTAIATSSLTMPDGWIMNPANWQVIQISKNAGGDYYGGGPFAAPPTPTLWGVRGVVTPAIVAGTATVGAFGTQAQFFRRGGLRIDATNSHSDFFIKNLVAIRAEERGALAVYRPGAFGDVTTLE